MGANTVRLNQGLFWEALSRALEYHAWALAEYQDETEIGCDPDDLERFRATVVEPALRECDRLRSLTRKNPDPMDDDEGERRLVEQLEQCHQENLAAFRELSEPRKSMVAEEYKKSADKAKVLEAKCHEVRLALRKYRKGKTPPPRTMP